MSDKTNEPVCIVCKFLDNATKCSEECKALTKQLSELHKESQNHQHKLKKERKLKDQVYHEYGLK